MTYGIPYIELILAINIVLIITSPYFGHILDVFLWEDSKD